jgi:hypothetical protein
VVLGVVDRLDGAVAALIATCGEQLEQPPNGRSHRRPACATPLTMLDALARRGVSIARFGEPDAA